MNDEEWKNYWKLCELFSSHLDRQELHWGSLFGDWGVWMHPVKSSGVTYFIVSSGQSLFCLLSLLYVYWAKFGGPRNDTDLKTLISENTNIALVTKTRYCLSPSLFHMIMIPKIWNFINQQAFNQICIYVWGWGCFLTTLQLRIGCNFLSTIYVDVYQKSSLFFGGNLYSCLERQT